MAGNNAIGTGALILSANADGLVQGLDKAEKAAKKSAAKIEKGFGGGFTDSFISNFGGTAVGAIAAGKIKAFADSALDAVIGTKKLKQETDELARSQEQLARAMDRSLKNADEFLNAIADPKDRTKELERQITAVERMLNEQREFESGTRKKLGGLNDDFELGTIGKRLSGRLGAETERAGNDLKAAEAAVDKLSEKLADLREKKARALDPTRNPELLGEINKLTESLKVQRDTFGQTANQQQIYALKQKGATAAQLAQAEALAKELDELDKRAKAAANPPKLSGAFEKGSREAFSIIARFQTGADVAVDVQKRQLAEQQKANALLQKAVGELARGSVLKLI